jgi:hypothetical protein
MTTPKKGSDPKLEEWLEMNRKMLQAERERDLRFRKAAREAANKARSEKKA